MNFKSITTKQLTNIIKKYPNLTSASVILDNNVYTLTPTSFSIEKDTQLILESQIDSDLTILNDYIETQVGIHTMLDKEAGLFQLLMEPDNYTLQSFDSKGCFDSNDFIIVQINSLDFVFNLIFSKTLKSISNLTLKSTIKKRGLDVLVFLMQYNLLGFLVSVEVYNNYYTKSVLLPQESKALHFHANPNTILLETYLHTFDIGNVNNINDISIEYKNTEGYIDLLYVVNIKLKDKALISLCFKPLSL